MQILNETGQFLHESKCEWGTSGELDTQCPRCIELLEISPPICRQAREWQLHKTRRAMLRESLNTTIKNNIYHTIETIRITRFEELIERERLLNKDLKLKEIARKIQISPVQLSQFLMKHPKYVIGNKTARKIEKGMKYPKGWLDNLQSGLVI